MVVIGCDGILTFRLGTKDINKWWVFRPVEAIVILDLVALANPSYCSHCNGSTLSTQLYSCDLFFYCRSHQPTMGIGGFPISQPWK